MRTNDVLKNYIVCHLFMRCFICICNDTLIGLVGISRIMITKGNKLENIHEFFQITTL